jgi:hypothetical protein
MWLEGLGTLKIFVHLIVNWTRDLPACSIVPQPTTLPRCDENVTSVFMEEEKDRK